MLCFLSISNVLHNRPRLYLGRVLRTYIWRWSQWLMPEFSSASHEIQLSSSSSLHFTERRHIQWCRQTIWRRTEMQSPPQAAWRRPRCTSLKGAGCVQQWRTLSLQHTRNRSNFPGTSFLSSFFFCFFIKKRGSPREDTGGWCSSTLHLIRGVGEPHLCPSLSLKVAPSYPIDADVRIYADVITFLRPGALPDTMSSGMPDDSF